jgi:putative phosphoesterase
MKLVVFSDVHGNAPVIDRIIAWNQDADYYLSLGDTELDVDYLMHRDIVMIKGNYRQDAGFVFERDLVVEDVKILLTHGHLYNVHRGLKKLFKHASSHDYQLVLYGHTHIIDQTKIGTVQFLNPGSCSQPRNTLPPTYMVITIHQSDIKWKIYDAISNQQIEVSE